MTSVFELDHYTFDLPEELIAQQPLPERSSSRLLVDTDPIQHSQFEQLVDYLQPNDLVILNNTKVVKSRLRARKSSGGILEVMVVEFADQQATALIRASKAPQLHSAIEILDKAGVVCAKCQVEAKSIDGYYQITLLGTTQWLALFIQCGELPLPPYIRREAEQLDDERYQSIWASEAGAVAAPTASLHFSEQSLHQLTAAQVNIGFLTLHVGAGTFAPVRVNDIRDHPMHAERYHVDQALMAQIRQARQTGGRIIAVGTTVLRVLETLGQTDTLATGKGSSGSTAIFIYPGFHFTLVDCLLTNFHLPRSTLLMLVSAFAGRERIMTLYQSAIEQRYRFFSYGDAMLLTRQVKAD